MINYSSIRNSNERVPQPVTDSGYENVQNNFFYVPRNFLVFAS